ncbi:T9SS type A sorting domain-containing protein [Flavobacterium sp. NRK F10]|uniref:T9SS type A sorting domain-containing protein n=1 Tax=Flavobacterium sp. NRK F10 TaxID=2954931 RepID=UPI00209056DC|nr:T9SS type A sorting domain-containing protein [Flavobacterium sp. NRK F10]MCO6175460.1 T9SS type A sorting domain-containing protein [Flavobacterium sp. NRK F10]
MRKTLLSLMFMVGLGSQAQLYVGTGGYVYSNDQYIFVTSQVELNSGGNIFLRNQSQLLQGTTGVGQNTGLGTLSVFQEGTSDNFKYNYWCSPVGNPSATIGNSNFGISLLNSPTGLTSSTPVTVLPYGNYNGQATPLSIAQRWIYKFSTSNQYAQWVFVGTATNVQPGLGFTMKGTSGTDTFIADTNEGVENNAGNAQRYDFRGKPNDGNIANAVSTNNFTLVGNPYPSAIDLNMFLLDPANSAVINGQAYFWEQTSTTHFITDYDGGYGIYTPGTGVYTPAVFWNYDQAGGQETNLGSSGSVYERRFAPIGQGFMVLGTANGSIVMKNQYRVFVKESVANQSEFERMAISRATVSNDEYFQEIPNVAGTDYTQIRKGTSPYLRINAVYNDEAVRPTTIAFDDLATQAYDYGYDGRSATDAAPISFYYVVDGMSYEYASTAFKFGINEKVPVGFRCNETTTFKVLVQGAYSGFDDSQMVYMHDKQTGIYHDIKNNSFEVTLPAGDNRTRFEITFKNIDKDISEEDIFSSESFDVYQNNEGNMLTVLNAIHKDIVKVDLYDVTGKLVLSKENLGKSEKIEIPTSNLSDGVYIVKLATIDAVEITKKVSIYK